MLPEKQHNLIVNLTDIFVNSYNKHHLFHGSMFAAHRHFQRFARPKNRIRPLSGGVTHDSEIQSILDGGLGENQRV